MSLASRSKRDLATVQKLFNTATITVGGLYLTSHSIAVTLIGATAGMTVTGWSMWLEMQQKEVCPSYRGARSGVKRGCRFHEQERCRRGSRLSASAPAPDEPQAHRLAQLMPLLSSEDRSTCSTQGGTGQILQGPVGLSLGIAVDARRLSRQSRRYGRACDSRPASLEPRPCLYGSLPLATHTDHPVMRRETKSPLITSERAESGGYSSALTMGQRHVAWAVG
jgi:hypothetical protein